MRITMGCGSTGRAVRLEFEVTAPTPADAVREVLRQCADFARVHGCDFDPGGLRAALHSEVRDLLEEARAGRAKAQERRDRWRKRAEDAESALCAQVEATEASFRRTAEARAELDEALVRYSAALCAALRERDEARAEADRLRAELKQAQARSAIAERTIDAATTNADRVRAGHPGLFAKPETSGTQKSPTHGINWSCYRGGGGGASYHGGGIGQPPSVTLPVRRSTAQAPNPTPTAGSEVERLLRDLLGVVEAIRADLIRSREARR